MPVSDQQYDANQHEAGKAAVRCNALKCRIGTRRAIIPAKMRRYSQWLLRRMARSGQSLKLLSYVYKFHAQLERQFRNAVANM